MDKVYEFWFGAKNTLHKDLKMNTKLWFHATPFVDQQISSMFKELVESIAENPIVDNPINSLCSIIVLDQFPRHIYRGTPNAFKYDDVTLKIAEKIIKLNWINDLSVKAEPDSVCKPGFGLTPIEALFVYIVFLHQESIDHVKQSIIGFDRLSKLTEAPNSKIILSFKNSAIKHLEVLEQFDRYSYRNEALGRVSTIEELEFIKKNSNSLFMKSQKPKTPKKINSKQEIPMTKNKLKILCLHGWRQNGKVFRTQTKKIVKELADIADFHFPTAPISYEPQGDILDATLMVYEFVPDYSTQRVWWISSDGNKYYQQADISLVYLKQIWDKEGPFDGIMGFAQGGTMAAIMSCRGFNPQFLILISSYVPRADEFKDMNIIGSLKHHRCIFLDNKIYWSFPSVVDNYVNCSWEENW